MSEVRPVELGETPTVEVRVYLNGELIETQLCETLDEAAALVASREEEPGVECEVEDLSAERHDESSTEVGAAGLEVDYPMDVEAVDQASLG